LNPETKRWKLWTVWAVVILLMAFYTTASFVQTTGVDFAAFYWAGWCIVHGQPELIYDATAAKATAPSWVGFRDSNVVPFAYVPAFAFFMVPFALMPFGIALKVWLVLRLLLVTGASLLLMKDSWGHRPLRIGVALAILLASGPTLFGQAMAQSSGLVLAATVATIVLLRRQNEVLSGAAAAAVIKPIGLTSVLVLQNNRRALAWSLVWLLPLVIGVGRGYLGNRWHTLTHETLRMHEAYVPWSSSIASVVIPNTGESGVFVYLGLTMVAGLVSLYVLWHMKDVLPRAALSVSLALAFYPTVQCHYLLLSLVPFVALYESISKARSPFLKALYFICLMLLGLTYRPDAWPFPHVPVAGTIGLWVLCLVTWGPSVPRLRQQPHLAQH